jgi:hypothetical protein
MLLEELETHILETYGDRISPEPNSGCWIWTGALKGSGAGYAALHGATMNALVKKSRGFKCELMRHACDVSFCVNPGHLIPGTHRDNMQDIPPQKRRAKSLKAAAAMTFEQRSVAARKGIASQTSEQLSARSRKAAAAMTPESLVARRRKFAATLAARTPEQKAVVTGHRSTAAIKRAQLETPEQRSARAHKAWATKYKKKGENL